VESAYVLPTTNLIYDYDANSLLAIGNNNPIGTWGKSAGSGTGSLSASGSQRPLLITGQLNGYPCARFDGSNDLLEGGDNTTTYTHYVIFIAQKNISGDYPWVIGVTAASGTVQRLLYERGTFGGASNNSFDVAGDFGNDARATATNISQNNVWKLLRIQVSGTIHTTGVRVNNATTASITGIGINRSVVVPSYLKLGSLDSTYTNVDIARFAVYASNSTAPIDSTTIAAIELGLATQYGL
jgi:hypothetical protein